MSEGLEATAGKILDAAFAYRTLTGRDLGVAGKLAELLACHQLGWRFSTLDQGRCLIDDQARRIRVVPQSRRRVERVRGLRRSNGKARLVLPAGSYELLAVAVQDSFYQGEILVADLKELAGVVSSSTPSQRDIDLHDFLRLADAATPVGASFRKDPPGREPDAGRGGPPVPGNLLSTLQAAEVGSLDHLAGELGRLWNLGIDRGHPRLMCIVFGLRYAEQLEGLRPPGIKPILERAGLYLRWGNLVSIGRSMRSVLSVRTRERDRIPERPWMSSVDIARGLRGEFDRMPRERAIVRYLGVERASEVCRLQQVTTLHRLLEDGGIRCGSDETEEWLWAMLEELPSLVRYAKLR